MDRLAAEQSWPLHRLFGVEAGAVAVGEAPREDLACGVDGERVVDARGDLGGVESCLASEQILFNVVPRG